jgi:hypothetical protein
VLPVRLTGIMVVSDLDGEDAGVLGVTRRSPRRYGEVGGTLRRMGEKIVELEVILWGVVT